MHLYYWEKEGFKFKSSREQRSALNCLEPKQRRWCSGIMLDSHSSDPGSIPGRRTIFILQQVLLYIDQYLVATNKL